MATRLEELIQCIDPSRTIERVSAAVDQAFNSFRYENSIKTFEDYEEFMAGFVKHVEQIVLKYKMDHPLDQEFYWSRYVNLVSSGYESKAWKWNYEKVITGKDGGLYGILKEVASQILKDRSGKEISGRVYIYWNSLDTQEKLEAVDEFLWKFGHTIPSTFTEGSAPVLKAYFPRFLEQYPQYLLEIRRSVGRF